MAKIRFETGQEVEFNGTPTSADIEEVALSLGISPQQKTGSKSFLRPKELISSIGKSISEPLVSAGQQLSESVAREKTGELGKVEGALRTVGTGLAQGAQAGIEAGFGVATDLFSAVVPDFIEDPVRRSAGKNFNKLMQTDAGLSVIEAAQGIEASFNEMQPKNQQAVRDVFDVALTALDFVGAKPATRAVTKGIDIAQEGLAKTKLAVVNKTDDVRNVFKGKAIETLPEQQAQLTKSFRENIIGDRKAINNKIDTYASRKNSDSDTILRELIEEGGIPEVDGQTINYQPFIDSVGRENKAVSQAINRRAAQIVEQTDLSALKKESLATVRSSRATGSQLLSTNAKIEKIFKNLEAKYGNTLTADNINEIRVDMNKAFKQNADRFEVDAQNSIGRAARKRIEELDEVIIEGLEHQAKLNRVEGLAKILKREKISVNEYVEKMGGFAGVMLTSGLGVSALAGGPAGLLIAGMGAQIGSKILAKQLRKKAFSPERFNLIKASLDENPAILQKLIREADAADAAVLERLRLPATTSDTIAVPPVERSGVKAVQAGKGIPEQGKSGRFEKRFSSTGEDQTFKNR